MPNEKKQKFLFIDVDDIVDHLDDAGQVFIKNGALEKIKQKAKELSIDEKNIRLFMSHGGYASNARNANLAAMLRDIYSAVEILNILEKPKFKTKTFPEGRFLEELSNYELQPYAYKYRKPLKIEDTIVFFSLRSLFEQALDQISLAQPKEPEKEYEIMEDVANQIIKSLALSEKMREMALEEAGMISRDKSTISEEDRELIVDFPIKHTVLN